MSISIKVSWPCECEKGKRTGWIDGDTETIYCNNCSGTISSLEELTLQDVTDFEKIKVDTQKTSSHIAKSKHYGHNIDVTDDNEFVCTDCMELV